MLDMLIFSITAKDDDVVIKLLKTIPKDILFLNSKQRDFLVAMLKHHGCERSLDYLRTMAPEELKKAEGYVITPPTIELEKSTDIYSKAWNRVLIASKVKVTEHDVLLKIGEYNKLLENTDDIQPLHFLRAANTNFITQNYEISISQLENCVIRIQANKAELSPCSLVDAAITEFMFRLFDPLKVVLLEKFRNYFKDNLHLIQHSFSVCHEALLFPLSETITLETLHAASLSMDKFNRFKRFITVAERDYHNDELYQHQIKERVFILNRLVDWIIRIEKQNNFTVTFKDEADLENTVLAMKNERLVKSLYFYHIKRQVLHLAIMAYHQLGFAENPYLDAFAHAKAVYARLTGRNNYLFKMDIEEPETKDDFSEGKKTKPNKKKKCKAKVKSATVKLMANESPTEKKWEDYKELPTYYPDVPMSIVSDSVPAPQPTIESLEVPDTLSIRVSEEHPPVYNRRFPAEIYAIFGAFNPKELFLTGLPVCELLHGRQVNYFKFATLLENDDLLHLLRKHVALIPDAKLSLVSNEDTSAIQVNYSGLSFYFYSIITKPGDSLHSALMRDACKQFFTLEASYVWIENGKEQLLDIVNGAQNLCAHHVLELSNPNLKSDCFILHPRRYLEAIYLQYKYEIRFSSKIVEAIQFASSHIESCLYQIDEKQLRAHYNLFIRDFGKTASSQIFIRHGIFKFMIDRGLFSLGSEPLNEKYVATPRFHS